MKNKFSYAFILMCNVLIFSCQPQKSILDAKGDLQVQIAETKTENNKTTEVFSQVTLKNVSSLLNVNGSYVQFYYAPGSNGNSIYGDAPTASFIRDNSGTYVAKDPLTQQMFALYYHIQSLVDFNKQISDKLVNTEAFKIGLNTQVNAANEASRNNAFFDGQVNALLFVPYSLKNIPISMNSGIIAHEFFHSFFYSILLKNFNSQQDILLNNINQESDESTQNIQKKLLFYNQTYIRGINEGLADFWGWIYTQNIDYISSSLPQFGLSRKLELDRDLIGSYVEQKDIEGRVNEALQLSNNPTEYLSSYIYRIGTPHARFLKELTTLIMTDTNVSLKDAQLVVAQKVYKLLQKIEVTVQSMSEQTVIQADSIFKFFAKTSDSGLELKPATCDFVLKYIRQLKIKTTEKVNGKFKEIKDPLLCKGTNE